MTTDLDIYRNASELIKQHGNEATIHEAMQADKCLEQNEFDGKAVWMRVIAAIKELPDQQPPPSGTLLH